MPSRYKQPHNILHEKISEEELERMEKEGTKEERKVARLKWRLRRKIHHGLKRKNKSVARFYEWLEKLV